MAKQPKKTTPTKVGPDLSQEEIAARNAAGTPLTDKLTQAERDARKAAKQAILEGEDAKSRFKRLSTARLNAALDVIALIGNLSGANYDYSEAQIAFIRDKLHSDVNKAMDRFKPKVAKEDKEVVEIPD